MSEGRRYGTFRDFYPFYLTEHSKSGTRRLHFIGTLLVLLTLLYGLATGSWMLLLLMPVFGYTFAWVGHFFVERNRPATFQYPLYSLAGDFRMFADMLRGRVSF
ncbi:MAG TPA: DUF962 domain-containing protein [Methylomirabilota bacterium]|jgi:hypothetical protein|nr:DUF962 domain-containing protein [Methylomirabilota bacterium]